MVRRLPHPRLRGLPLAVFCSVVLVTGGAFKVRAADGLEGAWQVACVQASGCQMLQSVAPKPGEKPALLFLVSKDEKTARKIGVITVPLKVYLTPGIRIAVDGKRPFKADFELCDETGCHAGFPAEGPVLDALSRGKRADVTVWTGKDRAVVFPLDLAGFTKAFQRLDLGMGQ